MILTCCGASWTVLVTGLVWAVFQQGPFVLVADPFGVSWSWSLPRMSVVLRSPSALAPAGGTVMWCELGNQCAVAA
jgi:hypothetical protein